MGKRVMWSGRIQEEIVDWLKARRDAFNAGHGKVDINGNEQKYSEADIVEMAAEHMDPAHFNALGVKAAQVFKVEMPKKDGAE